MCYTNSKQINCKALLDPILKRPEQHPKQTASLCGCLCFSPGNSIVLLSGLLQLRARALFPEPVYLWVGGVGEDMQCAVCGRLDREHGYTTV